MEFSSKMLESFYNYASSFAQTQAQMIPQPQETFVPLSVFTKLVQKFWTQDAAQSKLLEVMNDYMDCL